MSSFTRLSPHRSTNPHHQGGVRTAPRAPPPRFANRSGNVAVPDASAAVMNALAMKADDYIVKIASESGISSDLLRKYYVTQCTTVRRPSFGVRSGEAAVQNGRSSSSPRKQDSPSSEHSNPPMIGFEPPGATLSTKIKFPVSAAAAYSCDIEAALNGAISDEDPDFEEDTQKQNKKAVASVSKHLDYLNLDSQQLEISPSKPAQGGMQKQRFRDSLTETDSFSSRRVGIGGWATDYVSQTDLNAEEKLVQVSHVVPDKNHFYVRILGPGTDSAIEKLDGVRYSQLGTRAESIIHGMPCVVKFGEKWHRGRIEKLEPNRGSIIVFLVDDGVIQEYRLPKDAPLIRALPSRLATPPLAYRCSLSPLLLDHLRWLKQGKILLAKFNPVSKGKRGSGTRSWEITQLDTGFTEETAPGIQQSNLESKGFDASSESNRSIPVLPEAKRKEIGEWVSRLEGRSESEPGRSRMYQPPREPLPALKKVDKASTSIVQQEENWD